MIDGGLRQLFHRHLRGHWQTIETGAMAAGVPDSNWCMDGQEGWVEFKQTRHWAVSFRPLQVGWITRRIAEGGRVHVAVRRWPKSGPQIEGTDELWLIGGRDVAQVARGGLRECTPTLMLAGGPRSWDWGAIREVLLAPEPPAPDPDARDDLVRAAEGAESLNRRGAPRRPRVVPSPPRQSRQGSADSP